MPPAARRAAPAASRAATAPATSAPPVAGAAAKTAAAGAAVAGAAAAKVVAPKAVAAKTAVALSGPQRALRKLGLERDLDLLLHLPLRWDDETKLAPIATLGDGASAQVEGRVVASHVEQRARRQLLVQIDDGSARLTLRFLHFHTGMARQIDAAREAGRRLRARGELRDSLFGRQMVHPQWRLVDDGAPLPTTLTPVYPASAQLPQAYLRKAIAGALARTPLPELLPADALPPGLPSLRSALLLLHQPPADLPPQELSALEDRSHPAWQRIKFDELLAQQLSQWQARRERALLQAPRLAAVGASGGDAAPDLVARLLATLPFALTAAQRRVSAEIDADLARGQPMHRLLQGDVGSGKTVVAALAAARAIGAGWQCALMAPTELLAEQHFRKLAQWLQPLGVGIAWLSGGRRGKARRQQLEGIADGSLQLVVGTHAVIQQDVRFSRLGLAIVDEQHRFGVAQRLALRSKLMEAGDGAAGGGNDNGGNGDNGRNGGDGGDARGGRLEPHLLMMSATPIPRTLAMSYYADLAVSTIDELPPGRTPVRTRLFTSARRPEVIGRVVAHVAAGGQAYWVCPLVEESEALDLRDAVQTHAELTAALAAALPPVAAPAAGARAALLHGRMAAADKAAVMAAFSAGEVALLVATTVIEVGVDVPNASLMVVEHAERFGLAQLHQLRGRVGRGAAASTCVLLYSRPLSQAGKARLQAMAGSADGFEIARLDLQIRGPGEFMGARQSGAALLRFADPQRDAELLAAARQLARRLLATQPQAAAAQQQRWLAARAEYLKA